MFKAGKDGSTGPGEKKPAQPAGDDAPALPSGEEEAKPVLIDTKGDAGEKGETEDVEAASLHDP